MNAATANTLLLAVKEVLFARGVAKGTYAVDLSDKIRGINCKTATALDFSGALWLVSERHDPVNREANFIFTFRSFKGYCNQSDRKDVEFCRFLDGHSLAYHIKQIEKATGTYVAPVPKSQAAQSRKAQLEEKYI